MYSRTRFARQIIPTKIAGLCVARAAQSRRPAIFVEILCLAKRARRDTRTVARSVYKCSQTGLLLSFDNSLRGYGAFTLLAAT